MTTITAQRPTAPGTRRQSYVVADAITMLRRNLLHMVRYPGLSVFTIVGPVVFLLLFVFVFGGTLGAVLPGVHPAGGREAYLAYVTPGILLITIAGTAGGTATTVAMDMTEGITARFRTMAISRAAVLAGHVRGNTIQAVIAVVLVLGVGLLIGFRPTAGPIQWIAAVGMIVLIAFAITWLAVAMGMQVKSVETASNLPMVLILLPFLGSGFVPTESMPVWLQGFAQYQPFTPFIETIRRLLLGTQLGSSPALAIGWCVVITGAGLEPSWVPSSSLRMVSMNGVNGWYCANPCNHTGIDSVGTKPLPRNGSKMSTIGRLLAVSTDLTCIPIATASQVIANAMSTIMPTAAIHSIGPAVGRNPISRPTPSTSMTAMTAWMVLPSTCPASTEAREIAIVRNRAVIPSVMSIATVVAVPPAVPAMVISRMPGMTYARYASRPPAGSTPGILLITIAGTAGG